MRSNSKDTRENQKNSYDQRILERQEELKKKGIDPKDFIKDNVYEHLKAKRRAIVKALAAIDAVKARNVSAKEAKEAKKVVVEEVAPAPAAPKEKKPKKEKAAPAKAAH